MDVVQVAVETATKAVDVMSRKMSALIKAKMDEKQGKETGKGLSTEDFTSAYKAMLDNAVTGVKGDKESVYRTGNVNVTPANIGAVPVSSVGTANGVAELDANGKVLSSQLPSYVDDVLEYASVSAFPTTGESGKIYVSTDTNLSYRWTGSGYVEISPSLTLGETSSTAYRGDRGKTAYDHAQTTGNAHNMVKADIGLGNVDNTSDANKPVSTAQQAALAGKVDKISGKGLSTNDYTDADKTKLSGIAAEANKTIIDTTLSNAGQAADAKTTGDEFSVLKAQNALFREYFANMDVYRTASGNPATFDDAKAANLKNVTVTITPTQSGSGDPSPSNVRPTSGVSSVAVTRTGKNRCPLEVETRTVNGVTFAVNASSGSITVNGTVTDGAPYVLFILNNFSDRYDGKDWILSGCPSGGSALTYSLKMYIGGNGAGSDVGNGLSVHGSANMRAGILIQSGVTMNNAVFRPMIRLASDTDPTFEPYQGASVTVPLVDSNSDPLTVYGGTLDVTAGTLTLTYAGFTVDGDTVKVASIVNYGYGKMSRVLIPSSLPKRTNGKADAFCSIFRINDSNVSVFDAFFSENGHVIIFKLPQDITEVADANEWFASNPAQVVYGELKTNPAYTLTAQQLTALAGYNSVSASVGSVSVTYKADPVLSLGGKT